MPTKSQFLKFCEPALSLLPNGLINKRLAKLTVSQPFSQKKSMRGGRLYRGLAAIPKLKISFATCLQSRIHRSAGMVPTEQLLAGGGIFPGVQIR